MRLNDFFYYIISAPEYTPYNKKLVIKEEPKRKYEQKTSPKPYVEEYKKPEPTVQLEQYYYGILVVESVNSSAKPVKFKAQVNIHDKHIFFST